MLSKLDKQMLESVVELHDIPLGAFSLRKNGEGTQIKSSENIKINKKKDKPGIDVIIKDGTINENVYVPVIVSQSGLNDMAYNTYEIGQNSNVTIFSGCGIHNTGNESSQHDGVHEIFVRKNARMKYVEKHFADGSGNGKRIFNPITKVEVFEGGTAELEMTQIKGVDSTQRHTEIILHKDAKLIIKERLLTNKSQFAKSYIKVKMIGENASSQVISKSVAQDDSIQNFEMEIEADAKSKGHIQCDSIIMGNAKVSSIPKIDARNAQAELIHEAAIGRIASDQITKLLTIGISEAEAEEIIIKGFLN